MKRLCIIFAMLQSASAFANTDSLPTNQDIKVRPTLQSKSYHIDTAALLEAAKIDYKSERYEDSFDGFRTVLVHDRQNIDAAIGLGNSALSLGLYEEAYTVFSELKNQSQHIDTNKNIVSGYALARVNSGKSRNVVRDMKDAIAISGQDYRLWNALGRYYDQVELWGDSFDAYFTALAMGQGRDVTLNNLGMSQMMQGNYAGAHESFASAAAIKPNLVLYDNNRRLCLALQSDYANAVKGLTGLRVASIFNDAGYLAMTRGEKDLARLLFKKAIKISPVYHTKAHANMEALNAL